MVIAGIGSNLHDAAKVLAHALNTGRIYAYLKEDKHNAWTKVAGRPIIR